MRTCTSAAPASRSIRTSARWVLPRTIESSTTTSRLPSMTSRSGLSLSRMPSWRMVWRRLDEGAADVGVLDQALAVRDAGLPRRSRSRPGVPDSGVGMTRSASTGCSTGQPAAHLHPRGVARCGRRWWCPGGPGRRTRTGSPWARGWRSAASAGRPRRSRPARPARSRGRRRRRRCRARPSRWPPPSRARAGRAPAGGCPAGRGPRRAWCSSMNTSENAPRSCGSTSQRGVLEAELGAAGQQGGDQVGVRVTRRGALPSTSPLARAVADQLGQLGGVGQVAVVPQRDRRRAGWPGRSAGRSPRPTEPVVE